MSSYTAPTAQVDDGLLDLIYVTPQQCGRCRFIKVLLDLDDGSYTRAPCTSYHKVSKVNLVPRNGIFSIDGERYDISEVEVNVLPRILNTYILK